MIPSLVDAGGPWDALPPGIHYASLAEIQAAFVHDSKRKALFPGLSRGVSILSDAGCRAIYLGGSFVTGKPTPRDFDVCWDPIGVNHLKLVPVLLVFENGRAAQKKEFGGEFLPSSHRTTNRGKMMTYLEYFQIEKHSGKEKGILRIQP